jgi:flagellar L-ring protein FlgH
MPHKISNLALVALAFVAAPAAAKKKAITPDAFAPTVPVLPPAPEANGAIFQNAGYAPLTSGTKAAMVGDILTIVLVERTAASKSNSASTGRSGEIGLTPPVTGPLSVFTPGDIKMGGDQSFKGKGETAQSNNLTGEISVTIAEVRANGVMLVKGEKLITLNRGDETVQFSGLVRTADIGADNRIASTRVADAHIRYTGKGEIARASKQGWLQKFFSIISPF